MSPSGSIRIALPPAFRYLDGMRIIPAIAAPFIAVPIIAVLIALISVAPHDLQARERTAEELQQRNQEDFERKKAREERWKKQGKDLKSRQVKVKETVPVVLIRREKDEPPALSNLDPVLQDEGLYGARIGIEDNNTTGVFTGQVFEMEEVFLTADADIGPVFDDLIRQGHRYFITDLLMDDLLAIAKRDTAKSALIFNTRARDDSLRNDQCRANLFHITPSRAMLSDALIQYLVFKNWKEWLLIRGQGEDDGLFAAALRRSAKKFRGHIVEEKTWAFTHDARRTARSEVPRFTKNIDYQILLTADEEGEFGEYLVWNTWNPSLVAGSQGLIPTPWHRTHERWGAAQMQNRFRRAANRWMTLVDYAAWTAVRAIGEAALRVGSAKDSNAIRNYLRSDKFEIAAYKGIKLSFRPWSQQLRQRILLAAPRAIISFSPQPKFLHPHTTLDTLGFDRQETSCPLAKE